MTARRLTLALAACLLMAPAAAQGQSHRAGDVYARVSAGEVVLGNAVAERRWSRSALRTTSLVDKRRGGRRWSAGRRDFSLSIGGNELGSELFRVDSAGVRRLARGGLRVTMRLSAAGAPGLTLTRTAEAYPGIAGFRTQTTVESAAPAGLTAATLDEAGVGATSTTVHAFRSGADWREPDYRGPDFSIGDKHAGTWHVSRSGGRGRPVEDAAQWLSAADGPRTLFMVMERNDFPSSRAEYDGSVARLRVDYSRDVVILGPLEEQGHVENPFAGEAGRGRALRPGVPLRLEAAFTGFGDHDGDEPWQFHRYLTGHRLTPYAKAVTFNSNGTDDNVISTGAKDDMNYETVKRVAPVARKLGIDTFILDDGWQARSGDWQPDSPQYPEPRWDGNPRSKFRPRFPDAEFRAVRKAIAPMKLGLWMSPMHFNPSSETFKRHPEWACQPIFPVLLGVHQADPDGGSNEAGIIEWGPRAIPHIESRLRVAIQSWGVVYFKFDFLAWLDCADQGDVYEYKEAFVAMIDRLQRDFPKVTFQIDETNDYRLFPFESVTRAPSWFQNGSPEPSHLLHNIWNLAPYVPGYSLGQHFLGGRHEKKHPVETIMAGALTSHLTFFSDLRQISPGVVSRAAPWTRFYKENRSYFAQMTYPLLEDPVRERWTALQPWNPDSGRGALLAFRQDAASASKRIGLKNVPPDRRFDLFRAPTGRFAGTVTSAELTRGLPITLPQKRTARVLLIKPAARPRVSLKLRCRSGRIRASLAGRDRKRAVSVRFAQRGRVRRDSRAPFVRTLGRSGRVSASVRMRDGRKVRLRRTPPLCARLSVAPRTRRAPRFTG